MFARSNEVSYFGVVLPFDGLLGVLSLELVKFFPWGHVSAPTGVAPEALEEWEHSSKGYEHNVGWLGSRVIQRSFQLASAFS